MRELIDGWQEMGNLKIQKDILFDYRLGTCCYMRYILY